ncbi:MAG: nitroreductase family protein [Nitrososphaerota archaeon]|nr:nitroreductase family protein [Candidatus Calditenuaceae archaeon]MDW8073015.1 nitroreductase family protein [Nitrososphaerota archaeon]
MESRSSSKLLAPGEVEFGKILRALEAAITAPSAHNAQPWRVIIINSREVLERLLEEMAKEWARDLKSDGLPDWKISVIIEESKRRTLRASLVIIVCLCMDDMDHYPDERRMKSEYIMAVQSIGAFIENLLLALHAQGLGACWRCGPLFAQEAVRRVLSIPDEVEPQALIEVAYPGGTRPKSRKSLSEIAWKNRWGEPLS